MENTDILNEYINARQDTYYEEDAFDDSSEVIKQVMAVDNHSSYDNSAPSTDDTTRYSSNTGNTIELINEIGTAEDSLENMLEYHGNPEDMDKFMN